MGENRVGSLIPYIVCLWQCVSSQELQRELYEKSSGAALLWTQLVPDFPATVPLQDIAEPIRQAGGTSAKTYLRNGKCCTALRRYEKPVRNSPADTKAREGGGQGAPGAGADIALQPMEMTMVEQLFTCCPWERSQ